MIVINEKLKIHKRASIISSISFVNENKEKYHLAKETNGPKISFKKLFPKGIHIKTSMINTNYLTDICNLSQSSIELIEYPIIDHYNSITNNLNLNLNTQNDYIQNTYSTPIKRLKISSNNINSSNTKPKLYMVPQSRKVKNEKPSNIFKKNLYSLFSLSNLEENSKEDHLKIEKNNFSNTFSKNLIKNSLNQKHKNQSNERFSLYDFKNQNIKEQIYIKFRNDSPKSKG